MEDNIARAFGRNMPVSTKQSVEICKWIRGKNTVKAKKMLENVMKMKEAVPFTRFNKDMGHKKGKIAAGRYPIKTSEHILNLIKSAEINAQAKGLGQNLILKEIIANRGSGTQRYGRKRGVSAKRTHVEVILEEIKEKREKKVETKETANKVSEKPKKKIGKNKEKKDD